MKITKGHAGIDVAVNDALPRLRADGPDALGLMRRENDKLEFCINQCAERCIVGGRFRQPQRFGIAPEALAKVVQAPANLCAAVALVAERQDRVMIALRDGVAVPAVSARARAVGFDDARVSKRMMLFEPRDERRAEVETDIGVVVDNALDAPARINHARESVRAIALAEDAFVPIGKGARARLRLDGISPRIFARRLIEMAVYD